MAETLGTDPNLTGFVDGSSGRAAIEKIVNVNKITAGTHFFDGIDMYAFSVSEDIPQITFAYWYAWPIDELSTNDAAPLTLNYAELLAELDRGGATCVDLGSDIAVCAAAQ